jgi:hypothetical protein
MHVYSERSRIQQACTWQTDLLRFLPVVYVGELSFNIFKAQLLSYCDILECVCVCCNLSGRAHSMTLIRHTRATVKSRFVVRINIGLEHVGWSVP